MSNPAFEPLTLASFVDAVRRVYEEPSQSSELQADLHELAIQYTESALRERGVQEIYLSKDDEGAFVSLWTDRTSAGENGDHATLAIALGHLPQPKLRAPMHARGRH
jgi:hypothetical protein